MKPVWIGLSLVVLLSATAAPARAQSVGVRAGVSGSPDQFYTGLHYESEEIADRLRFRPNIELGLGSNRTLVALNVELAYTVPLKRRPWNVYLGAGPALNIYRLTNSTDAEGGFNIMVGLAHRRGLFTELKVGAIDSPSVKFGIGYTFRP